MIPLVGAFVLAVVAVAGIVLTPDIKMGFSSTKFEVMSVGFAAILGAVFAVLASLINAKKSPIAV